MKKYLLLGLSLILSAAVWAQERTVTGTVTDAETGEPVPGANVVQKGTTNGTITDFNGQYKLAVGDDATLVFSFVGYAPQEAAVGARSVIDVSLELDVQSLSEVVVVGYGTQEKKEITSAVASISSEEFNNGNQTTMGSLVQGKVAGLSIQSPGGDPNASPTIRLRGLSTFGGNTSPLVVIDGVIGASLSNVDPNDIASIDVLKDASAAAIYGSRASSGVILVTTKSAGKGGATKVDINSYVTMNTVAKHIDVLNKQQFLDRIEQINGGIGSESGIAAAKLKDYGSNTDWFKQLTRTGWTNTTNVAISGSLSANTSYRVSMNYRDNNSIIKKSGFKRMNSRMNIRHSALDGKLRLSMNGSMNTRNQQDASDPNNDINDLFRYATIYNPTAPVYENQVTQNRLGPADSAANAQNFGPYFQRANFDYYNPVALLNQRTFLTQTRNYLGNIQAEYDILDGLTAKVNISRQYTTSNQEKYWSKQDYKFGFGMGGSANKNNKNSYSDLNEFTLNYTKTFGDLDVSILGGISSQKWGYDQTNVYVRNFVTDNIGFNNLGFAGVVLGPNTDISSQKLENIMNSAFGRLNLNYANTYFLSVSARRDAYNGFGANNKAGVFPAVSGGLMLTELVDLGPVNQLKLRGSIGRSGNLPSNPYFAQAYYQPGSRIDPDNNPLTLNSLVYTNPVVNPNPSLKWETKTEINLGFDMTIWDRLTVTADIYKRNIQNLIYQVNVAPGAPNQFDPNGGFNIAGNTWANTANLSNGGIEAVFSYADIALGPVKWTPSINFTFYKRPAIDKLLVDIPEIRLATPGSPGQNNNTIIRDKPGELIGNMYAPHVIGVDELHHYVFDPSTPYDDPSTWNVVGNGLPKGEGGWNNQFAYKNFTMSVFFRAVWGHDLYNTYRGFYENADGGSSYFNSVTTSKSQFITSTPTLTDLYVENASFIRLQNMQIGYNIPIQSKFFSNFNVYVAGQNLFTITGYTGIDPTPRYQDVAVQTPQTLTASNAGNLLSQNLAPGIERRNTYAQQRQFTLGVKISIK